MQLAIISGFNLLWSWDVDKETQVWSPPYLVIFHILEITFKYVLTFQLQPFPKLGHLALTYFAIDLSTLKSLCLLIEYIFSVSISESLSRNKRPTDMFESLFQELSWTNPSILSFSEDFVFILDK